MKAKEYFRQIEGVVNGAKLRDADTMYADIDQGCDQILESLYEDFMKVALARNGNKPDTDASKIQIRPNVMHSVVREFEDKYRALLGMVDKIALVGCKTAKIDFLPANFIDLIDQYNVQLAAKIMSDRQQEAREKRYFSPQHHYERVLADKIIRSAANRRKKVSSEGDPAAETRSTSRSFDALVTLFMIGSMLETSLFSALVQDHHDPFRQQ